MRNTADTVKKNLYRGVSGLLAAAVLLSGSSWVKEVQARNRSIGDISITFSEGDQPSDLRYQAALAVHLQAEEEYEEALEAATLAAERLAAEKAAEELKNNISNLETPENIGDSVGIQGGSSSGKNPSLNLQSGGLLDYEDRYVNLFEEEDTTTETTESAVSKRTSRLLAYGEELIAIEGVLDRRGEVDEEVLIEVLGLEEALQEPVAYYSDTTGVVFDAVEETITPDISGCISLPGPTFADVVQVKWDKNTANYVDCETFFFDDLGTGDEIPETSWSYTFTGWHIVDAGDIYLPGETVFQSGDTITPDVLAQYVSNGSLELEAVWGKCYYIRNPYENMEYYNSGVTNGWIVDTNASKVATGASDDNDGRTPDKPKATIDGLYKVFRRNVYTDKTQDRNNAYFTAVMLTGDLDYYKDTNVGNSRDKYYGKRVGDPQTAADAFISATYKSYQGDGNGTRYNYYYKPQGYYSYVYGNVVFDNVSFQAGPKIFGQTIGSEFQLYTYGSGPFYFEATARFSETAIATFRPNEHEYVVVNAGSFSFHTTHQTAIADNGKPINWYVGRNASITSLTCGTSSTYETAKHTVARDFQVVITGGSISTVYGGSGGMNSMCIGDRTIKVYGDNRGGIRDPKINEIFGGAYQAKLTGDIDLQILNCSRIGSVHGGGYAYTATTYGDISISIVGSTIGGSRSSQTSSLGAQKGYIYGGGLYANSDKVKDTEHGGNVSINIQDSTVTGNIFGSGKGSMQKLETATSYGAFSESARWWESYLYPAGWETPPQGYPKYETETGYILVGTERYISWTDNSGGAITFYDRNNRVFLSVATVQNVSINISGSFIGEENNKTSGNIYGGGSLARVLQNTEITISETVVYGNVYGGGDGVTQVGKVAIYKPLDSYVQPTYTVAAMNSTKGVPSKVSITAQSPAYSTSNAKLGDYSWSGDASVLEKGGIDHENQLLYSENAAGHGMVKGNITVTINSGTFHGDVYGGGNKGKTFGNITLNINGGTFEQTVYGGANQADVDGTVTLNINGGTFEQDLYGANNQAGQIGGPVNVTLDNGTVTGSLFGGGNKAGGEYTVNLTVGGGTGTADVSGNVYGGGNEASVGTTVVTMNDGKVDGSVFGGNNLKGEIKDSTSVTLSGGSVAGNVYGGGNQAGNASENQQFDTVVTISGGTIGTDGDTATGHVYGGGLGETATVGNTDVTISGGTVADVYGGGDAGEVMGNTQVTVDVGKTVNGTVYGGGNQANVNGQTAVSVAGIVKEDVYGGGNMAGVLGGDAQNNQNSTTVTVSGAVGGSLFGGNNESGRIGASTDVALTGGSVTGNVYGGGNKAGNGDSEPQFDTVVTISGGTIGTDSDTATGHVYGGGLGTTATVGNTQVNITGGTVTDVYGGGDAGEVNGNTQVTVDANNTVSGTVYGGGNQADVKGMTAVLVTGTVEQDVYGGGNKAGILGGGTDNDQNSTSVTVSGKVKGNVFGGNNKSGKIGVSASVALTGGTIGGDIYGGGNEAGNAFDTVITITGGTVGTENADDTISGGKVFGGGLGENAMVRNTTVTASGGTILSDVYGGGYAGDAADTTVVINGAGVSDDADEGATVYGAVYGGGFEGSAVNTEVRVDGAVVDGEIYGGGFKGTVDETVVSILNSEDTADVAYTTVYGGGYGASAVSKITSVTVDGAVAVQKVYGGGNAGACGTASVTVNKGDIENVYGGGYEAQTGSTNVVLNGDPSTAVISAVYGGGEKGHVSGDGMGNTAVLLNGAKIESSLYGGGYEGNVSGLASVTVNKGEIGKNLYGGGFAGTVSQTSVLLEDEGGIVTVSGSVFGGGEGTNAYVYDHTDVVVDLGLDFTANETLVNATDPYTSGQSATTIQVGAGPYSRIFGSVYGGGDLGRVGDGSINQSNNTASVTQIGSTCVTVKNGWIGDSSEPDSGHVFGGGNGIPGSGERYNVNMGTVFGKTETHIWGGYMLGNVYGGGKQSRLYSGGSDPAATVEINQNMTDDAHGGSGKIAIGGSVFGGGDRGSGANVNASVPTTVGDAVVNIVGAEDTTIYFLKGGVYGDGNLCLVKGTRTINMIDFTTPAPAKEDDPQMLKTFYSLQRADVVNLSNTDIVLLGAIDLVDETDTTIYSINRIGALHMNNGSTVKLDQIVKYLGELTSDIDGQRKFIERGNNGKNQFELDDDEGKPQMLTDAEIQDYYAAAYVDGNSSVVTAQRKNTVCVANGLYLEVVKADKANGDPYGPIKGLFTLQLLRAVPGEGGGFVYGDIVNSTADFICETKQTEVYKHVSSPSEEEFNSGIYYVRIMGKGYQLASGTFDKDTLYYVVDEEKSDTAAYMMVVDNVGGVGDYSGFAYYYWYINGSTINYSLDLTGYIGSSSTETAKGNVLPEHEDYELGYVLYGLTVNQSLAKAVNGENAPYQLVQSRAVTGQQIAIELRLDDADNTSLGFLNYINGEWVITRGSADIGGYYGDMNDLEANVLGKITVQAGSGNVHRLMFVLHKASTVNTETTDMNLQVYIDLFEYEGILGTQLSSPFTKGASMLTFDTTLNISRIRPVQKSFYAPQRQYGGVSASQTVQITNHSAMSTEYQTAYLPGAYPLSEGKTMRWMLSTKSYTYYEDLRGNYLTTGNNGYLNIKMPYDFDHDYVADQANYDTVYREMVNGEYQYFYWTTKNATNEPERVDFAPALGSDMNQSVFPAGTKLIMLDLTDDERPGYYYYICSAEQEEIDLMDFIAMGTNTPIRNLSDADKPTFMKVCDGSSLEQVEERLVFVADFEQAQITGDSDDIFAGGFTLQHRYGDNTDVSSQWEDVMDYVETIETKTGATYNRKMPSQIPYEIHETDDGVDHTELLVDDSSTYRDYCSVPLNIRLDESERWFNTLFAQGEFSVTMELLKPAEAGTAGAVEVDGKWFEHCDLPEGAAITYNGVSYGATGDKAYIVVPIEAAGAHSLSYYNGLYGLRETVSPDDTDGNYEAAFQMKFYSSPDAQYFNAIDTQLVETVVYAFTDAEEYSLTVSMDNQVLASDGQVIVALRSGTTGSPDAPITMQVYRKTDGQYGDAENWASVFSNAGNIVAPDTQTEVQMVSLQLNNAAEGTYRLVFIYGDKRETVNFIVSGTTVSADNGTSNTQ